MTAFDFRAKISPKPNGAEFVFGPNADDNILKPFYDKGGALIFPFTPTVGFGGTAEYESSEYTHSIYKNQSYNKSYPSEITVTGEFIAQTVPEAEYLMAVMHWLKSITKAYFGVKSGLRSGTPPPVLLFDYLGEQQFNSVPVLITNWNYVLEPDNDYVLVDKWKSYVPTRISISITLEPFYTPSVLRDTFDLDEFRQGKLLSPKGYV